MITSHLFRPASLCHARKGAHGGSRLDAGMCAWLGTCNRPQSEHASSAERTRQAADEQERRGAT